MEGNGEIGMGTLSDKRLGYFYEAATCGSVRGAADRLNVEPSVVSRQIQQLEQDLGVALFERKGRGIVPTDAAALVLEHCRNRLASEEALRERIDELAGLRRGTLRLLVGEGYVDLLMNGVIDVFCKQYPGVQVAVELASAADAVARIATDEAHIGVVMNAPAQADIEVVGECSQPVCIVTWPDHPLTKYGGIPTLREAAHYPVAIMAPGFGLHQLIRLGEFAEGIQLDPVFTSGSIALLKRFVMKRLGVTFLSGSAVAEELARGELVAIRSGNTALEAAKTRVIVRKGRVLTEATRRMLGLLEGAFRQQQTR